MKYLLMAAIAALFMASSGGASTSPSPSDYTPAQLQSLAATGSVISSYNLAVPDSADYWGCWSNVYSNYHGTWPQQQVIYLHTYWCGSGPGGVIKTRTSYTTHASTFCSGSGDYAVKVSGGAGYSRVVVEGGAYFSCPTGVPYINTHWHVWIQVVYYPGGGSAVVGSGP